VLLDEGQLRPPAPLLERVAHNIGGHRCLQLDAARRTSTFDEVVGGLTEATALFEARRCLSCGNCFECDNCYGVCPDNAVIKLGSGNRYTIDLDYCKGCGICAAECPSGAIDMVPEEA
jgi:2-oxoacid:acceptor oxidoreductase delta subunit (pyruvate/2-ketoisovalerate family)